LTSFQLLDAIPPIEKNIDAYLSGKLPGKEQTPLLNSPAGMALTKDGTEGCVLATTFLPTNPCLLPQGPRHPIYRSKTERGHVLFANDSIPLSWSQIPSVVSCKTTEFARAPAVAL